MRSCTVHPRSCGDRLQPHELAKATGGSSPLVRGSGLGTETPQSAVRFIPARAGIGLRRIWRPTRRAVHPRSCGDRRHHLVGNLRVNGSSPLVRGSERCKRVGNVLSRFIPARAGIGAHLATSNAAKTVHPRSCGDRIRLLALVRAGSGSSPPARGSGSVVVG